MTKIHKLTTYLLIGTLVFAGERSPASATEVTTNNVNTQTSGIAANNYTTQDTATGLDGIETEEPVAGINLTLDEIYQTTNNADKKINQYLSAASDDINSNMGFAQVSNYVNVRNDASEDGDIIGKLYDSSAATILTNKNGWYKIKSGSVTGYVKDDFIVTGDKAAELAKTSGTKMATVTTTTLKIRQDASLDSNVLDLAAEGDEFKVKSEKDGWVKVALGKSEFGYVSSDFVKISMDYEEAVSKEEEQQGQADESAADTQSTTTSHNNSSSSHSSSTSSSSEPVSKPNVSDNNTDSSGLGSKIVSYAVQFQGNPYVWGGTSLTNGADCSGFTQSVFRHFGIGIPRTSRTQAASGNRVSISNLKPGDLIFYTRSGSINHVALYIGSGRVISASSPSTGIRITSYNYRAPYMAVSYIN